MSHLSVDTAKGPAGERSGLYTLFIISTPFVSVGIDIVKPYPYPGASGLRWYPEAVALHSTTACLGEGVGHHLHTSRVAHTNPHGPRYKFHE